MPRFPLNTPLGEQAQSILKRLKESGFEAYLVGGCVRDFFLGITPKDYDIATSAHPDQVEALFSHTVPVGAEFGVQLVVEHGNAFQVATFRTEGGYQDGRHPTHVVFASAKEDARRRDFTMNALYYDPTTDTLLDFFGGEADITRKNIQTIGDPTDRFCEDYLRLLRAVRFSTQLSFTIAAETFSAIAPLASKITRISSERIRDELSRILVSQNPERGITLLDESTLLQHILPEVITLKGVEQPMQYHPEGDVFVHTMLLMKGLSHPPLALALGCLLHDIAKPQTFERAPDRIRFHGHDRLGAQITETILRRLAYPKELIGLVCRLVADHLKFKDAKNMRGSTLKRFVGQDRFDLHLELHRLDCLASHGDLTAYTFCKSHYEDFQKEKPTLRTLLTGQDLIRLGYKPGPSYSAMLKRVEDAQLEGRVVTVADALDLIQRQFPVK